MLTIRNINNIVGTNIYIGLPKLAIARIEDVYEWIDNRYEFRIKVETPDGNSKRYHLNLDRNKIQYPNQPNSHWELSYDGKPNQIMVEALDKEDLKNMGEVIKRIENIVERILE
jgi:hypothetical protein